MARTKGQSLPMQTINPTLNIFRAFGCQGGTIHQAAEMTGLTTSQILNLLEIPVDQDIRRLGWSSVRTCSLVHNLKVNFPAHRGNVDYWIGVVEGVDMVDKLGETLYPEGIDRQCYDL